MAHIDYYFAAISPFTYLAGQRLEQIAAKHGATITYKPLDPMALFPRTGGQVPKDRHPSRMDYRAQELRRWSAVLAMPLNLKPAFWPTNAAPASYAIIAAQKVGGGDLGGLVHAVTRACWAEERNVAEDEVIRDLLAAHGYDPGIADRHMLMAAETYANNLEEAVARGVFGAPFYFVGEERFWGQDRLDHLDLHLAGKL
ncbi:MAG: 2-hydroxychromene-2-carboxylate isomerase [Rhodobacteraceae bacterium]|jgi:2-hydroxychromene-2-carboxylate isomerase|nr:2-hydroxychromene-2-carboxylate isomerase [Paracoccaceae bacterium]